MPLSRLSGIPPVRLWLSSSRLAWPCSGVRGDEVQAPPDAPLEEVAEHRLEGDVVVARDHVVGAGHLVGPSGIVEILKGRNYSLEQISTAAPPGS